LAESCPKDEAKSKVITTPQKFFAAEARARRKGGDSAAPERRSPACSVRSRSQQKSFLFLLEEKIRRAQKKSRENFFAGWRALASGDGANKLPFRSKKVRAKDTISPLSYGVAKKNYRTGNGTKGSNPFASPKDNILRLKRYGKGRRLAPFLVGAKERRIN
jgi:hypothetical protein